MTAGTHNHMGEPHMHDAKWEKLDSKSHQLYDSIYMYNILEKAEQ